MVSYLCPEIKSWAALFMCSQARASSGMEHRKGGGGKAAVHRCFWSARSTWMCPWCVSVNLRLFLYVELSSRDETWKGKNTKVEDLQIPPQSGGIKCSSTGGLIRAAYRLQKLFPGATITTCRAAVSRFHRAAGDVGSQEDLWKCIEPPCGILDTNYHMWLQLSPLSEGHSGRLGEVNGRLLL